MNSRHREVQIMEGDRFIQMWRCPEATLPDGGAGVLWRGVAYRLQADDRIDLAEAQHSPSASAFPVALLQDADTAWVLVPGAEARLRDTRQVLEVAGVRVRRAGRWLGDAEGEAAFDWYVCCDTPNDPQLISAVLGSVARIDASPAIIRLRSLEDRLAKLRADTQAGPPAPITRPAAASPEPETPSPAIEQDGNAQALAEAWTEIALLTAQIEALRARPAAPLPTPSLRLFEELRAVLSATRPDVVLMRDSWQVLAGEFRSRDGFWRAVGELPMAGGRPAGWKRIQAADKVWERHVSDGQNVAGRAYARFDSISRQWHVLLGWKTDQDQDLAWLRRQA